MIIESFIGIISTVNKDSVIIENDNAELEIGFDLLPEELVPLIRNDLYIKNKLALKVLFYDNKPAQISIAKEDWN